MNSNANGAVLLAGAMARLYWYSKVGLIVIVGGGVMEDREDLKFNNEVASSAGNRSTPLPFQVLTYEEHRLWRESSTCIL